MGDYARRKGAERSIASSNPQRFTVTQNIGILPGFCVVALALSALGCGDGEDTGFPKNLKARGALVSVDAGETTVGFPRGTMRVQEKTKSFKISKHPITKKQYQECEAARICGAPKLEECSDPALAAASFKGSDDAAAICVGRQNAETYCKWAGGRLPTLAEWLRAARGPSVQAYPWGSTRASCAQHPKSVEGNVRFQSHMMGAASTEGCDASSEGALLTKKHPAGAAAGSGMEDVLIAPAELLQGSETSPFATCRAGEHCLVYGGNPGSIDSVQPYSIARVSPADSGHGSMVRLTPHPYAFRCIAEK